MSLFKMALALLFKKGVNGMLPIQDILGMLKMIIGGVIVGVILIFIKKILENKNGARRKDS